MSKSKNKVSKAINGLTKAQYADLLVAMAEYRAEFAAYAKRKSKKTGEAMLYDRIFTEPRLKGARTKYWDARGVERYMQKFIEKHPKVIVGKTAYTVTASVSRNLYFQSCSFHFKKKYTKM